MRPTIHQAAATGDNDLIRDYIREAQENFSEAGLDLDLADDSGMMITPLIHAVMNGHASTAKLLLDAGAKPDSPHPLFDLFFILHMFSKSIDVLRTVWAYPQVRALSKAESPSDYKTPIVLVATLAILDLFKFYYEAGEDLSMRTENGGSVLSKIISATPDEDPLISFANKKEIIELCLKKIDVNDRNRREQTLLISACTYAANKYGYYSADEHLLSITTLLENGAYLELVDCDGMNALMTAAEKGQLKTVELLHQQGAILTKLDKFGRSALDLADLNGHEEIFNYLLAHGAEPGLNLSEKNDELIKASQKGQRVRVKLLLAAGADPNAINEAGDSALDFASFGNHLLIVEQLLAAGSDPFMRNEDGVTAIGLAKQKRHVDVVNKLRVAMGATDDKCLHRIFKSPVSSRSVVVAEERSEVSTATGPVISRTIS